MPSEGDTHFYVKWRGHACLVTQFIFPVYKVFFDFILFDKQQSFLPPRLFIFSYFSLSCPFFFYRNKYELSSESTVGTMKSLLLYQTKITLIILYHIRKFLYHSLFHYSFAFQFPFIISFKNSFSDPK